MPIAIQKGADDSKLRELLDREFDGTPGLMEEFPLLVGSANPERSFVAEENGQLVGHTAWRPLVLRSGDRRLPAAGIGLVTTHREWRGRGLAPRLVEACVEDAASQGAWLVLLFAQPRALYTRLGFRAAGQERMTHPDPGPGSEDVRAGDPKEPGRLLPLLERHPVGVERTIAEFEALLRVRDTRLYVLEEGNRVVAYCVEGRGRDMRGVIHEWAGDPPKVARLLHTVTGRADGPEWILSPGSVPPPVPGTHNWGPMAQIRILAPSNLGSDDPAEVFGHPGGLSRLPIYVWGLDSF